MNNYEGPPDLRKLPRWQRWAIVLGSAAAYVADMVMPRREDAPNQAIIYTLLLYVALFILSDLLRPKPNIEDERPKGLGDFQFPTATEGRVVPLLFGRNMVAGPNVVWYGDLAQEAVTQSVRRNMFSKFDVIIGFKYRIGFQMVICRSEIDAVTGVWIGEKRVFTGSTTSTISIDEPTLHGGDQGNGGVQASLDIHVGTNTQAVSDYLALHQDSGAGTNRTPRYTRTCYVVARELGVAAGASRGAYVGNSTSIQPWKFEVERFPDLFPGQTGTMNKIGTTDCNPINVIYEVLVNTEWGFGHPVADIDVGASSSFKTAADTCITEANGFSMVVDGTMEASAFLQEILRQIDGVLFLDQSTGKWTIKLARDDYTIGSVPQLTEDTVKEVKDFTRGSWEDTSNQVSVKFAHRDNDYKESYALAQDMANAQIQGGGTVSTVRVIPVQVSYPGVKDPTLASTLAWRDLRGVSFPLARATFVTDRTFWQLTVGDVVAWTDSEFGFTQLPMRVVRLNHGDLQSGQMEIVCVQDVFQFLAASYAEPPATGWTTPVISLIEFPSAETLAFEAPRALLVRDPQYGGDEEVSKVMCAARRQGGESTFQIGQRNAAGTPSGAFSPSGNVSAFMLIGELTSEVTAGVTNPTSPITITADPDTQAALESAFDDSTIAGDLGTNLTQLIQVGTGLTAEFMLVTSASNNGANVDLENVYRGALDTGQRTHAAGTKVYLIFNGAAPTDSVFPNTYNVDIELRMSSLSGTYAGAISPDISLTMDKRAIRPYPPAAVLYNGSGTAFTTPSLEGAGGPGENDFRIDVDWWRRRYNPVNEVSALAADDTGVDASHEVELEVIVDPDGAATSVLTSAWTTGTGTIAVNRNLIIGAAAAGTEVRFRLKSRHDIYSETNLESLFSLDHDVTPSSTLSSLHYMGGNVAVNTATTAFDVLTSGVHTVRLGAAYTTSLVEIQVNGGGWSTVVSAGATSGATASLTAGDDVELRFTVDEAPDPNFVEIEDSLAARVAYGTFS